MRALFTSKNLIGDGLYTSLALRLWAMANPQYTIDVLTLQDHVACIYEHMGVPVNVIFARDPDVQYDFEHVFDCVQAFALSDRHKCHIAEAYASLLGIPVLANTGVFQYAHLKPTFIPTPETLDDNEKDLVLVSMFSASCSSRKGGIANKMLPWHKWDAILRFLRGRFNDTELRFLGAPTDRAPDLPISEDEYMTGIPLNRLALIMKESRCVVSVDNGMSHLAASQEAREFVFYPKVLGTHYILPKGNIRMAAIHMDPNTIVAAQAITAMRAFFLEMRI